MNLLNSSTFRHGLIYAGLFSVSVVILFAFIYWFTAGSMMRQADVTIQTEISSLNEHYERRGLSGLADLISQRVQRQHPTGSSVYLLLDPRDRKIVGNLNRWPDEAEQKDRWLNFDLTDERTDDMAGVYKARAQGFRLRGGYRLLVGRDIRDLSRAQQRVIWSLGWGLAIMLLLGLVGGLLMSRSTSKRIETINQTSRKIMTGDLGLRIPTRKTNDEYDQLADNLNRMLDKIELLMEGVQRVSDSIAHDLKTPLARLRNQLENARNDENVSHAHALESAVEEADGLLNTFNALLRIARIEAAEQRANFSEVDLTDLLNDVIELYEPVAEEKQILISESMAENVKVNGDRDLVFQAIANVLDNAIKYSPQRSEVTLSLASEDNTATISIADQGPGVSSEHRDKIFQRFFRLDQSRSTSGNGLGLSLVQAVVKLHDAHIELEDNNPGLMVKIKLEAMT